MNDSVSSLVLAAPSGTGKTTLARRLVDGSEEYVFSISATTRDPREGERNGIDYHFVDQPSFAAMVERGELAEWAEVHGQLYGTPRQGLEAAAARGEHVVLDIDVQGARRLRQTLPSTKLIFILPPSIEILISRLIRRGTERPEEVARRLESALQELQAAQEFDYVVVNDDVDGCLETIRGIANGAVKAMGPEAVVRDIKAFRREILRILDEEYAEYVNMIR